jgi:hypothetical protein
MVILELLACGWCWCEVVHPVPMLTVDCSCHSLLLVRLYLEAFTPFLRGTVLLGCPNLWRLGRWLYTYHCGIGYTYRHNKTTDTHIHIINYNNHKISEDWPDLLLPTLMSGHSKPNLKLQVKLAYTFKHM